MIESSEGSGRIEEATRPPVVQCQATEQASPVEEKNKGRLSVIKALQATQRVPGILQGDGRYRGTCQFWALGPLLFPYPTGCSHSNTLPFAYCHSRYSCWQAFSQVLVSTSSASRPADISNLRGGLSGWGVRAPNGSSLMLRSTYRTRARYHPFITIPGSSSMSSIPLQRISKPTHTPACLEGESKTNCSLACSPLLLRLHPLPRFLHVTCKHAYRTCCCRHAAQQHLFKPQTPGEGRVRSRIHTTRPASKIRSQSPPKEWRHHPPLVPSLILTGIRFSPNRITPRKSQAAPCNRCVPHM